MFLHSLSPSHYSISIVRHLAFFQRARCPLAPQPRWLCYKKTVRDSSTSLGMTDRRTRAMQFFKPKLIECLRNYDRRTFFSDLAAGVTVGIVELPLTIGFVIASGVTPAYGLWIAIIACEIIVALGVGKVQIGGPTGAFFPILFS